MKMTDLSQDVQAVLDAYVCGKCDELMSSAERRGIAAALRALAVRIKGADNIPQDVLDIANELDGATTTSEND